MDRKLLSLIFALATLATPLPAVLAQNVSNVAYSVVPYITSDGITFTPLGTATAGTQGPPGGQPIAVAIYCPISPNFNTFGQCNLSGGITGVTNTDGTLIITTATGVATASLNLGHANTWTALQTFNAGATIADLQTINGAHGATANFSLGLSAGPNASLLVQSNVGLGYVAALSSTNIGGLYTGPFNTAGSPTFVRVGTAGLQLTDSAAGDILVISQSGQTTRLGVAGAASTMQVNASVAYTPKTITASATPAITTSPLQTITLNANATPTVTITSGEHLVLQICQPATGGPFTWTWPATIHGGVTIGITASTCSQQAFDSFNGTSLEAESPGTTGLTP